MTFTRSPHPYLHRRHSQVSAVVEDFPDLTVPTAGRKGPIRRRRQSPQGVLTQPPISRGIPLETAVRAYHASCDYVAWKPRIVSLVISFLVLSLYSVWSFHPNRTPLGWVLTIVWSMPIVGTLVGIQGALLLRRRVRNQEKMAAPTVTTKDALIVAVPTIGRHDTYPALERSVISFVEHLPVFFTHFRVDVIVEEGCEAAERIARLATIHPLIRVITVPRAYRTPGGTRFKARANHFAHELRIASREARDDVWVLHMDDDTAVGSDTAAALAQFINRQRRAGTNRKHLAQGILTYPRENAVNWLTWMADAVRPADDFARFRAVTGSGTPVAGVHGELLLLRASIEATIGWDFGPKAIVEDAQFALVFCKLYPGRSDWFNGRCYGASPATVRDFVKQRERWSWGLIGLSLNRSIPLRYRVFIGWSVLTWVLGPLQHLGVVLLVAAALGASTSPVAESVLLLWATNFAYVIWSYWEGLRLNGLCSGKPGRRWFEPVLVVLLIPVFAFLEGLGGLRGFLKFLTRRENTFAVIAKPA
jgi:egghead protein (zeste-white 4 protein)